MVACEVVSKVFLKLRVGIVTALGIAVDCELEIWLKALQSIRVVTKQTVTNKSNYLFDR